MILFPWIVVPLGKKKPSFVESNCNSVIKESFSLSTAAKLLEQAPGSCVFEICYERLLRLTVFWVISATKLPLNWWKPENSTLLRWKNIKKIIRKHNETRMRVDWHGLRQNLKHLGCTYQDALAGTHLL